MAKWVTRATNSSADRLKFRRVASGVYGQSGEPLLQQVLRRACVRLRGQGVCGEMNQFQVAPLQGTPHVGFASK